jgi:hypothetical protein
MTVGGIVGLAGAGIALIDSLHEGHKHVHVAGRPVGVRLTPRVARGRIGAVAALLG